MQRFWNQYPFVRLIIPFLVGLIPSVYLPAKAGGFLLYFPLMSLVLLVVTVLAHRISSYRFRWVPGLFISLFMISAGYSLPAIQRELLLRNHFSQLWNPDKVLIVRLTEPVSERPRTFRISGKVEMIADSVRMMKTGGKILLYLEKDSAARRLRYGDYIVVKALVKEIDPPLNPGQFNYKKYLANSGIYHQAMMKSGQWEQTGIRRTNPVYLWSFSTREKMLELLERLGIRGDEYAVLGAILLGFDEKIEPELRSVYAGSGVMHVLCVSGLHVGIIFLLVSFAFGRSKHRTLRWIKFFTLILSIWAYAFVTGLSPSVMRASVMFSLFSFREVLGEKSNPYNIIAASALILLIIDPFLITRIGFQLSYAAVIGIVALYQPIYQLLIFRNLVADYFWKLLSLSLAAQIGTFPLSVYYFQQFPVYFALSNLIAVPLVWLIVYTGMFTLLAAAFWDWLAGLLARLLQLELHLLNLSVRTIQQLPQAVIDGLSIHEIQVLLIYLIIISVTVFFLTRKGSWAIAGLTLMVIFFTTVTIKRWNNLQQHRMVVYAVKGHSVVDFIEGKKYITLTDLTGQEYANARNWYLENTRNHFGVKPVGQVVFNRDTLDLITQSLPGVAKINAHTYFAQGKSVVIIGRDFPLIHSTEPLAVNYIILRQNCPISPEKLQQLFTFDLLIFDSSCFSRMVSEWSAYCSEKGIPFYNVNTSGALIVNL